MDYYSHIKEGNTIIYNNMMDHEGIMLSDLSTIEGKIPYDLNYVWNLKTNKKLNKQTPK